MRVRCPRDLRPPERDLFLLVSDIDVAPPFSSFYRSTVTKFLCTRPSSPTCSNTKKLPRDRPSDLITCGGSNDDEAAAEVIWFTFIGFASVMLDWLGKFSKRLAFSEIP